MGKTTDKAKPDAIDKAAYKIDKVADKAMDGAEKIADKFEDKLDKAKPGAEDEIYDKFTGKIDKVGDKLINKVEKIVHKVEPSAPEDEDAALYRFGGEGVAVGDNTFTQVETVSNIIDRGNVTSAKIDISVTAVAEGDSPYASADTYVNSNSDISLLINFKEGSLEYEGVSYDISDAKFIGICLPDYINLSDGPKNREIVIRRDGDPDWDPELDGNVAVVSFDAKAAGDETLVDAQVSVLAVEDTLSLSTVQITSGVD